MALFAFHKCTRILISPKLQRSLKKSHKCWCREEAVMAPRPKQKEFVHAPAQSDQSIVSSPARRTREQQGGFVVQRLSAFSLQRYTLLIDVTQGSGSLPQSLNSTVGGKANRLTFYWAGRNCQTIPCAHLCKRWTFPNGTPEFMFHISRALNFRGPHIWAQKVECGRQALPKVTAGTIRTLRTPHIFVHWRAVVLHHSYVPLQRTSVHAFALQLFEIRTIRPYARNSR